jgi:ribonuclease Z
MQLHVLGSGCPAPTAERFGSAFLLEVGGEFALIDCGPATTHKMARMGLSVRRVHHLFLTHHHFDHNAGVPAFALTRWDQCRGTEPPLRVYGPPPTGRFLEQLFGEEGAFAPDWKSRVEHPASHECHRQRGGVMPRPVPRIEASDAGPGEVAESNAWRASAARVHHVEPTLESLAYRFEADGGSVVFAGDCGDCDALRKLATGADTLVAACTHFGQGTISPDLSDVITGTPAVAEIAEAAGVDRLVLTHASPNFLRPGVKERAVADIARRWDGDILFPDELTTVDLR